MNGANLMDLVDTRSDNVGELGVCFVIYFLMYFSLDNSNPHA